MPGSGSQGWALMARTSASSPIVAGRLLFIRSALPWVLRLRPSCRRVVRCLLLPPGLSRAGQGHVRAEATEALPAGRRGAEGEGAPAPRLGRLAGAVRWARAAVK